MPALACPRVRAALAGGHSGKKLRTRGG